MREEVERGAGPDRDLFTGALVCEVVLCLEGPREEAKSPPSRPAERPIPEGPVDLPELRELELLPEEELLEEELLLEELLWEE
ncbi:MAG: hypothetical protein J6D46_05240 [Lachnospiraceae bacterium]|nr:hypothetical protein [Lachnospiraceae bacterium]